MGIWSFGGSGRGEGDEQEGNRVLTMQGFVGHDKESGIYAFEWARGRIPSNDTIYIFKRSI